MRDGWLEKRGRSVDEIVEEAAAELGVAPYDLEVQILEEPARGLLGLGAREARVRVRVRPGLIRSDKARVGLRFAEDVATALEVDAEGEVREDADCIYLSLRGPDLGLLIGRHGQTLEALQFLVGLAASRNSDDRRRIVLDIEGYRERREEALRRMAARAAEQVVRSGRRVELAPMPPHERRIIHLALQDHPTVTTQSEGEEPFRRVVVSGRE